MVHLRFMGIGPDKITLSTVNDAKMCSLLPCAGDMKTAPVPTEAGSSSNRQQRGYKY